MTPEDIKKLTDYQIVAFKDVFATKEDVKDLKGSLNTLQTSVDAIAKDKQTREQESTVLNRRMKNAENWIDQASPKVGVDFKH